MRFHWSMIACVCLLSFSACLAGEQARSRGLFLVHQKGPGAYGESRPVLTREILRQSILIAARDELGVSAGDELLGDAATPEAMLVVPDIVYHKQPVRFSLQIMGAAKPFFSEGLPPDLWLQRHVDSVADAEARSRTQWPRVLKEQGFSGEPVKKSAEGPVSPKIDDQLQRMELLAQLIAVRSIHL